jgi:hypothetical protein
MHYIPKFLLKIDSKILFETLFKKKKCLGIGPKILIENWFELFFFDNWLKISLQDLDISKNGSAIWVFQKK